MIKRSLSFFLLVIIALMFPIAASADVIIAPEYNSFYSSNYDKCVYLGRDFYANGSNGFIALKNRPGAWRGSCNIENGAILHISFAYNLNGRLWGITEIYEQEKNRSEFRNGWIPMDDLILAYDYISFEEDHQNEIYLRSDVYELLPERSDIVFWTWPGSGEIKHILEGKWRSNSEHEQIFLSDEKPAYRDAEGREWVFINYLFGRVSAWILLEDPENRDVPMFNPAPEPEPWRPGSEYLEQHGGTSQLTVLLIIVVALLVLVTAVLIRIFWKRKTK